MVNYTDEKLDEEIERLNNPTWGELNAPFDVWNQHRDRAWYRERRLRELNSLLQEKERRCKNFRFFTATITIKTSVEKCLL